LSANILISLATRQQIWRSGNKDGNGAGFGILNTEYWILDTGQPPHFSNADEA